MVTAVSIITVYHLTRYAHYDNSASFSDFSSFGGWKSPHVKQYAGDTTQCSMGVDKNYASGTF